MSYARTRARGIVVCGGRDYFLRKIRGRDMPVSNCIQEVEDAIATHQRPFKPTRLKCATSDGCWVAVEGMRSGLFGVHEDWWAGYRGYAVTHLPSRKGCGKPFPSEKTARRAIALLRAIYDWRKITKDSAVRTLMPYEAALKYCLGQPLTESERDRLLMALGTDTDEDSEVCLPPAGFGGLVIESRTAPKFGRSIL